MKEIIITNNEAGQRLDKLLGKYLTTAPKSFLYKMLRKKNIKLNDKKATGNEKLVIGDSVKLYLSDETVDSFTNDNLTIIKLPKNKLKILYEDNNIIVMNKPAGVLSQKAEKSDVSMNDWLIAYVVEQGILTPEELRHFRPSVCNRLDRNTSGIIIGGISLPGLRDMSTLLKERTLDKYYLCVVAGSISNKEKICGYLYKDEVQNKVKLLKEPVEDAAYIETEYTPIKTSTEYTLLKVKLITGRSHQIRAHLASIAHPIIGDYKYGRKHINDEFKKSFGLEYQLLHSYELYIPELTGALSNISNKTICAPVPDLFQRIVKQLFSTTIEKEV